jgi:hypothetical protein
VIEFVREGGRLLLLGAASQLPALFPGQVKAYRPCGGEIVTMRIPESPVFDGIEPMDLCWFELGNGMVPRACTGTYQVDHGRPDANPLAEVVDIHGYLKEPSDFLKISGSPLIELTLGSGRVLATEMTLLEAPEDPIAGRLLGNLIRTLGMP